MTIVQILLTCGIAFISLYTYVRLKSSVFDILLIIGFLIGGVLLVLFPNYSTKLANFVGIGRGVDLIIYLSILLLLFLIAKLFARLRKIEQKMTEIIRNNSIAEAEKK